MIEVLKPLRILGASVRDQTGATAVLRRFSDQAMTLTDAVGLHLMQQRKTRLCWSTDFHLGLTGVPLVIHQP